MSDQEEIKYDEDQDDEENNPFAFLQEEDDEEDEGLLLNREVSRNKSQSESTRKL
jgi:hypothetical protein